MRLLSQAASAAVNQKMPTSSTAIIRISLTCAVQVYRKTPADAGGHPQGQVVSVAQLGILCLMAIITSAFDLRQLFASA